MHLFTVQIRMLSYCDIKRPVTPRLTGVLICLTELDLHGNVLTKLPDAVGEMVHLTSINLANNRFSTFPDKLTEIVSLERINLEGNSITGNNNILEHVVCIREGFVYFKRSFMLCLYMFFYRNSFGEVVQHAVTKVAKHEFQPSGLKHPVCSAVST